MGVLGGGAVGQMLHNRRRGWMPLFVGACVAGVWPGGFKELSKNMTDCLTGLLHQMQCFAAPALAGC